MVHADTATRTFGANAAVNSGDFGTGDGGYQTTPTNAAATTGDNVYAVDTNSGTNSNSTCLASGADRHQFSTFGFTIPAGSAINGIVVTKEIKVDDFNTNGPKVGALISWDGSTFCDDQGVCQPSTPGGNLQAFSANNTDETKTWGGATNTWGHSWTVSEINATTFTVMACNTDTNNSSATRDFSLDYLTVTIHYSPAITVGGTVYTDEGSTNIGISKTVNLRVDGGGTYTDDTDASGVYSITTAAAAGQVITVYLDGETEKAVTVTRSAAANISDLHLYQNRLIIRHEDAGPMTNSNLDQYDKNGTSAGANPESDIHFTVTSGALTVDNDTELHIWTGDSFTPGGAVTTSTGGSTPGGDIHIVGTLTAPAAGTAVTIGGSWTKTGTFTNSSAEVMFNATATGKTISGGGAFYDLTFNSGSGGWTLQDSTSVDGYLRVSAGALTVSSNLTVGTLLTGRAIVGGGSLNQTGGTTTINNGANIGGTNVTVGTCSGSSGSYTFNNLTLAYLYLFSASSDHTSYLCGDITVAGVLALQSETDPFFSTGHHNLDLGSKTLTLSGSGTPITSQGCTLTAQTSTVNYTATAASVTVHNMTYYNLGVGTTSDSAAASTFTLGGTTAVSNTLTVGNSGSTNTDAFSGSSYTLTLSDTGAGITPFVLTSKGSFTASTSTVNYTGSASTMTLAATTYNNLGVGTTSDTAAASTFTLGGNTTVSSALTVGHASSTNTDVLDGSSYTLTLSGTGTPFSITSKGDFTASSSTVNYTGTAATITPTAETYNHLGFGTTSDAAAAATFRTVASGTYAVGGDLTIGHASSTNADILDVETNDSILDVNGSVTITSKGTLQASSTAAFTVGANWTNSGTFTSGTGTVTFDAGAANKTITTGGSAFNNLTFNNASGEWELQDTTTVSTDLTVTAGSLSLNAKNVAVNGADFTNAGIVYCGNGNDTCAAGTVTLTGSSATGLGGAGTTTLYNLNVGDGSTATTVLSAGSYVVSNTLTVTASATLNGNSAVITIGGSGTCFNLGGADRFVENASHVRYSSATGATVTTSTAYNTLEIGPAGDGAFSLAGDLTANGTGTALTVKDYGLSAGSILNTTSNNYSISVPNGSVLLGVNGFASEGFLIVNNSTVTIGGDLDMNDTSSTLCSTVAAQIPWCTTTQTGTPTVTVNGSVIGRGRVNLAGGTFTQRVGAASKTFGSTAGSLDWTFNDLKFENSSGGALTITTNTGGTGQIITGGTLTIGNASDSANTTLDNETNDRIVDANGNLTITSKGVLQASSTAAFNVGGNWSNSGTFTSGTGTVTFDAGAANKTITTGGSAFNNLTFNNALGEWELQDTTAVSTDLTVTAGSLSLNAKNVTVNGGDFAGAGTVYCGNGNNTCAAGAVTLSGTGSLGGSGSTFTFYDFDDSGSSQTTTLAGNIEVKNQFRLGAATSHVLDTSASNYSFTVGGQFFIYGTDATNAVFYANASAVSAGKQFWLYNIFSGDQEGSYCSTANPGDNTCSGAARSSTLTLTSDTLSFSSIFLTNTNSAFTAGTGIVKYANTVSVNVNPQTYYNLEVGTASDTAASATYTLGGNTTVSNIVTVGNVGSTNTDILALSNRTLTLSGSGTPLALTSKGTLSGDTGTVTYTNGTSANVAGTTYNNLTLNGAGTFTAAGNLTANGTLTAQAGTFEVSTRTVTAATTTISGGTLSMTGSGGKLQISGSGALSMSSGSLVADDVSTAVQLTSNDTDGSPTYVGVSLTGGTLDVDELSVDYLKSAGFVIGSGVTVTNFNGVTWGGNGQTGGTDVILDVTGQTVNLLNHTFPDSWSGGDCNVQSQTSGVVTMWDWSGGFGGENDDCDNGGEVIWKGGAGGAPGSGALGAPVIY